ncbi:MAG: hypothetical protein R3229_05835 [Alphaproteobacteria bacterium]|nr:hypothetical protein [Alphaproteobacteria bacterium]
MNGVLRFMAEIATALVVFAGAIGLILIILGFMVVIEANTTGGEGALKTFVAADQWVRAAQVQISLTPGRLLGSFAMALGLKITGIALAAAVLLDIMNSLRTIVEQRRR